MERIGLSVTKEKVKSRKRRSYDEDSDDSSESDSGMFYNHVSRKKSLVSKSLKVFSCLQFLQKTKEKKYSISALASQKWLTNFPNYVYENFQVRKPYNIFVAIQENRCLHKFILRLSDLQGRNEEKNRYFFGGIEDNNKYSKTIAHIKGIQM